MTSVSQSKKSCLAAWGGSESILNNPKKSFHAVLALAEVKTELLAFIFSLHSYGKNPILVCLVANVAKVTITFWYKAQNANIEEQLENGDF